MIIALHWKPLMGDSLEILSKFDNQDPTLLKTNNSIKLSNVYNHTLFSPCNPLLMHY